MGPHSLPPLPGQPGHDRHGEGENARTTPLPSERGGARGEAIFRLPASHFATLWDGRRGSPPGARVDIEWLILADAAQVMEGKLYLLGGGWSVVTAQQPFPVQQRLGIAAAVRVPWHETNQRHPIEIEVLTDDGSSLARIGAELEAGRPPGLPPGDQRVQLAIELMVPIERAGSYAVVARVDGAEGARTVFHVLKPPGR